jgi:predicted transposase YdaD
VDRKDAEAIMQITTSWHEKGREEGKKETAKAALEKGLPVDLIAEVTGFTRKAVLELKNGQN